MDWSDISVTPGTRAAARLPSALAEDRFRVHMDDLADAFCKAGRRLGAGALNRGPGPWRQVFHAEPAFLYAELLQFRPDDAAFRFDHVLAEQPQKALEEVALLARRLSHWIKRIRQIAPHQFSAQLTQLNARAELEDVLDKLVDQQPRDLMRGIEQTPAAKRLHRVKGGLARVHALATALETTHRTLRNAVAALQPRAREGFNDRITSGQMDPVLGLMIAELQTAHAVEDRVNRFRDRYTRFFYQDILGQTPRSFTRETVLLGLTCGPAPMVLPKGTQLEARLPDDSVQSFRTEMAVPLHPAQISDIATIRYEANPDISVHAAFDAITDVSVTSGRSDNLTRIFATGRAAQAEMGLDIRSAILALAEGKRRIEIRLNLHRASKLPARARPRSEGEQKPDTDNPEPELLMALNSDAELLEAFFDQPAEQVVPIVARKVTRLARRRDQIPALEHVYEVLARRPRPTAQALRLLLMRLAQAFMIEAMPAPSGFNWRRLLVQIRRNRGALTGMDRNPDRPADLTEWQQSVLFRAFSSDRSGVVDKSPNDVFQKLLGEAFDVQISTETGFFRPPVFHLAPNSVENGPGLTLNVEIDENAPPLCGTGPDDPPVLMLRMAQAATLCPISFLDRYRLGSVDLTAQVEGLKNLVAFSDDGPVATDGDFQPFGVQPHDKASFWVGSPELAQKPVTDIRLDIDWTDLPDAPGGLAAHYESYGSKLPVPEPKLQVDYLSGDGWKSLGAGPVPMLNLDPISERLVAGWQFSGNVQGHSEAAHGAVTAQEFATRQTIRAGVVRLILSDTADGFHAARYPIALTKAMRPRWRPGAEPVTPPKPFVPKVARLALSYVATARIDLAAPNPALHGDRVTQVGPFGRVEVYPQRYLRDVGLFPRRLGFGELYLKLTGPVVTGPMALTFDIAQSGHLRFIPPVNPVRWFYLSATGWQALPDTALSADTTAGLMRSGLVMIDLPRDAAPKGPGMPEGIWIAAVAMGQTLAHFPTLRQVSVNGVWVNCTGGQAPEPGTPRVWSFTTPQPGVSAIREIAAPPGTRPPETETAFITRVGERLKHRARAITPWDIERLVLEKFPEIWMAKCLPHLSRAHPQPAPGHLTLVVVPHMPGDLAEPQFFDVSTLRQIKGYLARICSEFAEIDVVNPGFEQLQVRARLQFDPEREDGAMAQQLKDEISRYLSVWTADGALGRFGWSLNINSLRAFITGQPYVRGVSEFSVLHLAGDDQRTYRLADTARDAGAILRATRPWSLPLPAPDHVLTVEATPKHAEAAPSGIGRIGVGQMLVVGQRNAP